MQAQCPSLVAANQFDFCYLQLFLALKQVCWTVVKQFNKDSYLVDSASSHMLVSKIKPCMSKYKHFVL